jgi:thiamine biosynthesis lipoprotein
MQEGVKRRGKDRWQMPLKRWRLLAVTAAVLILSGLAAGCGTAGIRKKQKPFDVQYLTYFDTVTSITIYADDEEQFDEWEQLVHSELERYHQLYDIYHSYEGVNNIKVINDHAGMSPVEVPEDILDLLEFSLKEYDLTGGGVHVGMGSVLSIWHDYREMALGESKFPMVPSMTELESAAKHMDIHGIHLDRQAGTVYLEDPEMRLDVGAVAKGYTAQRLADTLREAGVTNALLSLGGNVVTIGSRGDGKPWRVGIQNPDLGAENPYVQVVDLTDMCLVTSGTYQRFYEVDGTRYHHIINPELLMPWNEYQSVTILSPDSGEADALSTAVFNMKPEEGLALIESLDKTEALWILPDGSRMESSGFQAYTEEGR